MGPEPKAPSNLPLSEAAARGIIDAIHEPLLVLDDRSRVHIATQAFCRAFQLDHESIEGRLIFDLDEGRWDIPALRLFLDGMQAEDAVSDSAEFTHEFPGIGSRTLRVCARKVPREGDRAPLVLLAVEDVAGRYREEAASRRNAGLYQRLVASSPDCIKILDLDARLLEMSENGVRALCLHSVDDYIGTNWLAFWKGEDREAAERAWKEAKSGTVGKFEGFLPTLNGDPRWWEVLITTVPGRDGKPEYFLAVSRDITDRRRADEALAAAHEKLAQTATELKRSNEDLMSFAQIAGHDLKAPLRTMVLVSDLLAKNWKDTQDDESRKAVDLILQAGKRATGLIDSLLRYCMLAQAPVKASAGVSASDSCSVACQNLHSEIERTGADIECWIPSAVQVNIDRNLLMQVFQNLIGNAIHYRKENVVPRIRVTAEEERQNWLFCVEDNGIGIESRHSAAIFQPFRRLHGPEKPGNGIGLSSCKRIIERGDGRIWVESRPDAGSKFYFLLPKAQTSSSLEK